jgi:lactate dehydrogenase-like 2-hydroxyacid dehydrogenase
VSQRVQGELSVAFDGFHYTSTALGMKVIYNNRRRLPPEGPDLTVYPLRADIIIEENGATYVSFDDLLVRSRLITLHCPLTKETMHLLSDKEFSKMQDGVFIVNTSRGPGEVITIGSTQRLMIRCSN